MAVIVVDIGCYAHRDRNFDSITSLVEHFAPKLLFGFDPLVGDAIGELHGATLVTRRMAAWVRNGEVEFTAAGLQSAVGTETATPSTHPPEPTVLVPCFDLAAWILTLPETDLVVKMDVEGSEIPLLRHLHRRNVDERISLLLVEEHGKRIPKVACPVEEWWM